MTVHHSKRRVNFTMGLVDAFECPTGAAQVFLWDSGQPGLGLRAAPGQVAYVFRAKLHGHGLRMTIGDRSNWDIGKAREKQSVWRCWWTPALTLEPRRPHELRLQRSSGCKPCGPW